MKRAVAITFWLSFVCAPAAARDNGPQRLVDQFTVAWDASDPKAISALFVADADLVAPDGVVAKGRTSIEDYYAAAFAKGYSGSKGVGEILQERAISSDVALLDSRFTIVGAHKADGSLKADEKGTMAVVLHRVGAVWRIAALRERSGSNFISFPGTH